MAIPMKSPVPPSEMQTHDPAPPPPPPPPPPPQTLPLNVVEHILATVPHVNPKTTPFVSLLNVLSPKLVPTALASTILACLSPKSRFNEACRLSLRRLFGNVEWNEYSVYMLGYLKKALDLDRNDCTSRLVSLMAQAGNLDMMIHLVAMDVTDFQVGDSQDILADAMAGGHLNILQWWIESGFDLQELRRDDVIAAAVGGHLHVLTWWIEHEDPMVYEYSDSQHVDVLVRAGRLDILNWWHERVVDLSFGLFNDTHWELASQCGHVQVLDFAKATGCVFPKSLVDCIDAAATNGHVQVLDWWYNVTSESAAHVFDYSVKALDGASANGHVQVLDFFAKSGLDLRFTPAAMQAARENGHVNVVKWWSECRLHTKLAAGSQLLGERRPTDFVMLCAFDILYPKVDASKMKPASEGELYRAVAVAIQFGHLHILNTLESFVRDSIFYSSYYFLGFALRHNQPAAARWALKFAPKPPMSRETAATFDTVVAVALRAGHVQVLEVLRCAGLLKAPICDDYFIEACLPGAEARSLDFLGSVFPPEAWEQSTLDSVWQHASSDGNIRALDWLVEKGVTCPERVDPLWIDEASAHGHYLVLEWWNQNKLPFKFTEMAQWRAVKNKRKQVIRWWIRSGRVKGKYMLEMLQNAFDELDR